MSQVWGWALMVLAVCTAVLAWMLVFVVAGTSDGYSCGTLLSPNQRGGTAAYGAGGCGYSFRTAWAMVLILMTATLVLAVAGVVLVAVARGRRKSIGPHSQR